MEPNCYAKWFARTVWIGILVNLSFAVPALFTPHAFAGALGLGGLSPEAALWLRNAGMLLVVMSVFHAAVANDPLGAAPFARRAVAGRLIAAAFWLWLVCVLGLPGVLWWFFATDLALGLICGFLLFRALAVDPPPPPRPWRRSLYDRVYGGIIRWLEAIGILWYVLWPALLGSIGTGGLRRELRANNLHPAPHDVPDSAENRDPAAAVDYPPHPLPDWDPAYRDNRSPDGSYNDLSEPAMGMVNMPFARNFPPAETYPVVPPEGDPAKGFPSPREVSRQLLARPESGGEPTFTPATSLNLLAAAWIQFQNHGWFNHRIPKMGLDPQTGLPVPLDPVTKLPLPVDPNAVLPDFVRIPLAPGDDWQQFTGQTEMRVRRTLPDPTRRPGDTRPPQYRTTDTHWWDASQIYGSDAGTLKLLRENSDGLLTTVEVTANGRREVLLPLDPDAVGPNGKLGIDLTGFNDNHWVGTSLLHTLFVREHNYLCGELKARYATQLAGMSPRQADDWIFGKARLIVAGLMAKIHTIEWTPGILGNPRLRIDMDSNWWGVLGRWFKIHVGRVSENEGISGIIGSKADHHAAPFALTEDFIAVYRLHPLIPDAIQVHKLAGGTGPSMPFDHTQGSETRDALLSHGTDDWLYSFGRQHPGAITLRNYPKSLRQFKRMTGEVLDLATRDIVRDRERGVPAYNRFRELLRMRPMRSYQELVGHRPDAADLIGRLNSLYGEDGINRVDLLVGLFAEKVPPGFGFSDTAFRVFILMASRRLKSDRFFTDDFRPEVYTPFGIDWLNNETMQSLIERHYPALKGKIPSDKNTFAPW